MTVGEDEPRRVLSDALWESWGPSLRDSLCVRWDDAGSLGSSVSAVRLMTWTDKDQPSLPGGLSALSGVIDLELPSYLLKRVAADDLPPSVEELRVTGERAVSVDPSLSLPGLGALRAGAGPLRFSPEQFPSLQDLTIRLDRKAKHAADIVRGCTSLRWLGVTAPYDPAELPTFAEALPSLEVLGVSSGAVTDLSFVPLFGSLRELSIANIPKLTSIAPLADAPRLERLKLAHCQNITDIEVLLELPALREIEVVRCADVSAIRADLEARGLDRLTLI